MSDPTPTSVPGSAADDAPSPLTREGIDAILQDFRGWLEQAADLAAAGEPPTSNEPEFSWQTLVAEFTALRQEVNLQTKAARAQLEQSGQALQQLSQAVSAFERMGQGNEDAADEPNDEALRPLLKTLVDVYDAMALAKREVQRVQGSMVDLLVRAGSAWEVIPNSQPVAGVIDPGSGQPASVRPATGGQPLPNHSTWWRWWPLSQEHERVGSLAMQRQEEFAEQKLTSMALRDAGESWRQASDQARQVLDSLLVGYAMGLQRIDRALTQHELEPIACVGHPFDPECMEVVEVITEPGRDGTEVVDEVRRGYTWHDRVFRFAQVRVTKP